jgi:glucuronoarabinoxylan endo-1,4-beta-xylanase
MDFIYRLFLLLCLMSFPGFVPKHSKAQVLKLNMTPEEKFQTFEGFGASLAYYEGWLNAHPNKREIYDIIFGELSLDFLRVRNAHGYDADMIGRVKEYITQSERVRGNPIPFLTTSWGPPAYLKSNNDRSNGGTLRYTLEDGTVNFDYNAFAQWWVESLNAYQAAGIYPTFVSIQNEPDFTATYESCRLAPAELVNSTDTIAGYNKALETVYKAFESSGHKTKLLGPETIGIGYNVVQNYMKQIDVQYLHGIAHHLYHGVDENNPWVTADMKKVGELYPEIPHYQTEYERSDWFNLSGLIYKSLVDENVVAYFYWDLIWNEGGLVTLDNPWTPGSWKYPRGYYRNKMFFAFKQFSAFIEPGWQRINTQLASSEIATVGFMNSTGDSAVVVVVNRSDYRARDIKIFPGSFSFDKSEVYQTNMRINCQLTGELSDSVFSIDPLTISTITMVNTKGPNTINEQKTIQSGSKVYPNPFTQKARITHPFSGSKKLLLSIYDTGGRMLFSETTQETGSNELLLERGGLRSGLYLYRIQNESGNYVSGQLQISN